MTRYWSPSRVAAAIVPVAIALAVNGAFSADPIPPTTVQLDHDEAGDQDDLCIWRNAKDPARSLIITSDKKANLIAVYTLQGELLQKLSVPKPGNIDLRNNIRSGDENLDVVVVNQRSDGWKLAVFVVNQETLRLERWDRDNLSTGPNYGLCLYHSRVSGLLHAVITSELGTIEQYALTIGAKGDVSMKRVREWKIGKSEGAVADDELGRLYISEEESGVWELGAEPDQPAPGELVIRLGEHGLKPDLEGITLLHRGEHKGYLLLSSQGQSRFFVFERMGSHRYLGDFGIDGVIDTDGIDVTGEPLGEDFPHGLFGCHNAATKRCSVWLVPWEKISKQLDLESR